jgi:hypothetical protein
MKGSTCKKTMKSKSKTTSGYGKMGKSKTNTSSKGKKKY